MSRKEKKEARIDRYRELASKASQRSTDAYNRSNDEVKHIPFGQPILVGHHSERRHRATLERSNNAMRKSIDESNKADYYLRKAEAAENNNAIYTEDEDAEERLTIKIDELESMQATMKERNKIVKSKKLTDEQKVEQLMADGLGEGAARQLLQPDFCGRVGYADFQLSNNNAVIRNAKKRLEKIKNLKSMETKEYEVNGVKVVENIEENRFQIFFDSIPSQDVRKLLKGAGYRWSPTNECWQCYINSWNIRRGKEILNAI